MYILHLRLYRKYKTIIHLSIMDYTHLLSTQEDKILDQEDNLQTLYKQYLEELENKLFPAKQQIA